MLLTYGFLVAVAISILLIVISPKRIIGTMGAMSIVALSAMSIAGYVAALISKREGSFISTFRHSLFGRIDVVVDAIPKVTFAICLRVEEFENTSALTVDGRPIGCVPKSVVVDCAIVAFRRATAHHHSSQRYETMLRDF